RNPEVVQRVLEQALQPARVVRWGRTGQHAEVRAIVSRFEPADGPFDVRFAGAGCSKLAACQGLCRARRSHLNQAPHTHISTAAKRTEFSSDHDRPAPSSRCQATAWQMRAARATVRI